MKRLLVISHGFPPYYGGAEHAAAHLARAAARSERWQVSVLTSDLGGRLPPSEHRDGLSILRIPARKREWTRHTTLELLSFLRAARCHLPAIIERLQPDHVLAHFTLPAGAAARHAGCPYSVVLHGSDVPGYQPRRFGLLYPLVRPWCRAVWSKARAVIAVSGGLRDLARRSWPGGSIAVIPNGVDFATFQGLDTRESGLSKGWTSLVAAAQLIERKGLQHLLQALALLDPEERRRIRLHLYGVGPFEPSLRNLAARLGLGEAVVFEGLVQHGAMPAILGAADMFILPSLQEGTPLALLEAMAAGCPIVATRVGGIPDMVRDGEGALLVPPADPSALRDALRRLLADPALAARLGLNARQRAQRCDWSVVWDRYESSLS